jgi:hypothetical protein
MRRSAPALAATRPGIQLAALRLMPGRSLRNNTGNDGGATILAVFSSLAEGQPLPEQTSAETYDSLHFTVTRYDEEVRQGQ